MDYSQFARYVDQTTTLAIQAFLSCLSNAVVVALAWRIKAEAQGRRVLSKGSIFVFTGLTLAPTTVLLLLAQVGGQTWGGSPPAWLSTSIYVYVNLFSCYALLRLAKWLSVFLISLRKTVAVTIFAFGVLQLGLDWPIASGIINGQTALEYSIWTACLTMIGKATATIAIVVASSELSRRMQLKTLSHCGLANKRSVQVGERAHRQVAVIQVGEAQGQSYQAEIARLGSDYGLEVTELPSTERASPPDVMSHLLSARLAIIVVVGPSSPWTRMLVSLFLVQRKDYLLLVHSSVAPILDEPSVSLLGGVFSSPEDLGRIVGAWLRDCYHWPLDRLLGSPTELWKRGAGQI
jgi:hypothetical protein